MKNRVLVLMAHPDDAEIWAGGTLLNHYMQGDEILFAYMFCNDEVRKKEAIKSADRFNAKVEFWNWSVDLQKSINLVAGFKPTIIITHWEGDTHREHIKTYESVMEMIPVLVISYRLEFNVYCCDCYNSLGRNPHMPFVPTDFIDITSAWNEKQEMISAYGSQPTNYWLEMISSQNRMHGSRSGVGYAEGFIQIPILGIMRKSKKLLGGI